MKKIKLKLPPVAQSINVFPKIFVQGDKARIRLTFTFQEYDDSDGDPVLIKAFNKDLIKAQVDELPLNFPVKIKLNRDNDLIITDQARIIEEGWVATSSNLPEDYAITWEMESDNIPSGGYQAHVYTNDMTGKKLTEKALDEPASGEMYIQQSLLNAGENPVEVSISGTSANVTSDLPLWLTIANTSEALSFNNYQNFMDFIFCGPAALSEKIRTAIQKQLDNTKADPGDSESPHILEKLSKARFLPFNDTDAYRALKVATEAFLMVNCAVDITNKNNSLISKEDIKELLQRMDFKDSVSLVKLRNLWKREYLKEVNGTPDDTLPYLAIIRRKLSDIPIKLTGISEALEHLLEGTGVSQEEEQFCHGILSQKMTKPCFLELIWSYWHEEGMLVQTMNTISQRFQNVRSSERDPLAHLEIGPLRSLNNLLWGYIQDEQHRLTIKRRAYEYDHHYGLPMYGKAIPKMQTADSRTKFLEAFHNLLYLCTKFYTQEDDTLVQADGFPILNAIKEVHFILTEGMHNQYGDLPSTARIEMLIQQWLLARPEFREFLPTRIMVAYPEPWMDRVATMNKIQGWTDTNPLHFRNLAVWGEQLLLSIRFGQWSVESNRDAASNWARFFRSEIQGYMHAYRAVTGVDLTISNPTTGKVNATPPSTLLLQKLRSNGTHKKSAMNGTTAKARMNAGK